MKLYSDFPARRTRQIAVDVFVVALVVIGIAAAIVLHGAISAIGLLGTGIASAGEGFRSSMSDAGSALASVPLIGPGIAGPFQGAAESGQSLVDAGHQFASIVSVTAVIVALVVGLGPVALVALVWAPMRLRFARRAADAAALIRPDGTVDVDVLAAIELRRAGIRDPRVARVS